MAFSGAYRPPGVYAEEIRNQIIPSPEANQDIVALISTVPPTTTFSEILTLTGNTPIQLTKAGIVVNSITVTDREGVVTFVGGTDYNIYEGAPDPYGNFQEIERNQEDASETFTLDSATSDYNLLNGRGAYNISVSQGATTFTELTDWIYDPYANRLHALSTGDIPRDGSSITVAYSYGIEDGETIMVSYDYADASYYQPLLTGSYIDIRNVYGETFDPEDTINPVSFAASLIYANGGDQTEVRVYPVDPRASGDKVQVSEADWEATIQTVTDDDVSMVVETSGLVSIQSYIIQHIRASFNDNRPYIAFLGRDGVNDVTDRTSLRAYASALNYERVALISTPLCDSKVYTSATFTGARVALGTQYLAATLCGVLSDQLPQEGLTRKSVAGLTILGTAPNIFLSDDTVAGLLVVENKGGIAKVRHGITTAFADINTAEVSVMRAKDFLIKQMRESLDRTVIGKPMQPNLDFAVLGAAANILERMRNNNVITAYSQPQVAADPTDPTQLILSFVYVPNYPLNRILIQFSLTDQGANILQ